MSAAKCPHTHQPCSFAHLIKTDGTLWHGPEIYVHKMFEQGIAFQRVDNPTRTYYFEYDKTHPSYKERDQIQLTDSKILEIEII